MLSFDQPATFALAIYESRELAWHSGGLSTLDLGRQIKSETHDEPGKYGLVDGAEPLRLVIADYSEPTISRHQLWLQIGEEGLSITNTSKIRPVVVNEHPLSPESKINPNPELVVRVDLPGRNIVVGPREADVVSDKIRETLPSDGAYSYAISPRPPLHDDFSHGLPAIVMPMTDDELATIPPSQLLHTICESLRRHQIVIVPHSRSTCVQTSIANLKAWDAFSGDLGDLITLDLRDACGDSGDFSVPQFYKEFWHQLMDVFGLSSERENCEMCVVRFLQSATPLVLWFFNMHVVPSELRMRLQGLTQGNHRSVVFYERKCEHGDGA